MGWFDKEDKEEIKIIDKTPFFTKIENAIEETRNTNSYIRTITLSNEDFDMMICEYRYLRSSVYGRDIDSSPDYSYKGYTNEFEFPGSYVKILRKNRYPDPTALDIEL